MIETFTLQNGIKGIVSKIDGVRSCSIGVFVKAGSCDETLAENGISHFIEHTNFKGTPTRDAFKISWDSDALGVILNAATSKEYTYYYVKTISEHTEKAFDILADIFVNSTYPSEELEKEKGVVIEEINMYEDTPDDVCLTELAMAFYGSGDGFGRSILGPKENIQRFTRNDILAYKAKYYTTDNLVLSFVGDVDVDQAKNLAERYFSAVPTSVSAKRLDKDLTPKFLKTSRVKDIEQAHLGLGFKAAGGMDEKASVYFDFISNVLGGGMSSRLFQKIREQLGLCYNIYSYSSPYVDTGMLAVYAGLNGDNIGRAYEAIMSEIQDFKKSGIREGEFELVKEQIKSSLVFAQESTSAQMTAYGRKLLLYGEVYDFDDRLKKINQVTLKEVNDFIFDEMDVENYSTSAVGRNPEL
ncbi:MAG: insulinase family protein [Clostridia bacterium]|nr:insulinase family protein [Clostridia bacterium]